MVKRINDILNANSDLITITKSTCQHARFDSSDTQSIRIQSFDDSTDIHDDILNQNKINSEIICNKLSDWSKT